MSFTGAWKVLPMVSAVGCHGNRQRRPARLRGEPAGGVLERGVQSRVGVCAVPVAAAQGAEHHVAAGDGAAMLDLQVHGVEVDLQRSFIVERLGAGVAAHAAFTRGRPVPALVRPRGICDRRTETPLVVFS